MSDVKPLSSTCNICCENFSKQTRKPIECIHCSEQACSECIKKFLFSSYNEASCMFCKKEWNIKFLTDNFSKTFIWTDYKIHKENIYFERQLALLPETQLILEKESKIQDLTNDIAKIREESRAKERVIQDEIAKLRDKTATEKEEKDVVHGHCPNEDCRGFVKKEWECGICRTKVCKKCMEKLETGKEGTEKVEHVCNQQTVDSVKEIRSHSKQCPSCNVDIFKSEGCFQMFCTNCKIFFHWGTLEIIKKTNFVHNPHYTEWLNSLSQEERDRINAGRMINPRGGRCFIQITDIMSLKKLQSINLETFQRIVNILNHVMDMNTTATDINKKLETERIKYLRRYITQKEFKLNIHKICKKESKDEEARQVRIMFCETSNVIMHEFVEKYREMTQNLTNFIKQPPIITIKEPQEPSRIADNTNRVNKIGTMIRHNKEICIITKISNKYYYVENENADKPGLYQLIPKGSQLEYTNDETEEEYRNRMRKYEITKNRYEIRKREFELEKLAYEQGKKDFENKLEPLKALIIENHNKIKEFYIYSMGCMNNIGLMYNSCAPILLQYNSEYFTSLTQ